jgi:osmoprotectant transport system ATP-binding protein
MIEPAPLTLKCKGRVMSAAIEFRNVSFAVSRERLLLDNISLALEEGTTTAVLGRSGSGKTTLLRTVNRMVEPTGGNVLVHGKSARNANLIALRRAMGYVIQETGLFPHFTVERNVGVVLEAEGRPREERIRRCHELMTAVGLDPAVFAQRYPHQLSGGQRQRVGLARALAAEPGVLLMDEPFGALDPLTRGEMQDMLRGLMATLKKTVLLVTHDLDEALYLADRIVLLSEGKLIANLEPADFLRSSDPRVEAYVRAFHRGERITSGPNSTRPSSTRPNKPKEAQP